MLAPEFVPGQFECPRCGFTLVQATWHVDTGEVTTNDKPGEKCPNDDSPMWRVTWEKRCGIAEERLGRLLGDQRVQQIEAELMGFG